MNRQILHILIVEDEPVAQAEVVHAASVFQGAAIKCATTKREAEQLANRHQFDLAIVDLGLPDGSGSSVISQLAHQQPDAIIIAHTVFDDDDRLFRALSAGVHGYILKGQPKESLQRHLLSVAAGDPVISPVIAKKVLGFFHGRRDDYSEALDECQQSSSRLTPREREILAFIGKGFTIRETARILKLSDNTVKTHIRATYRKLNVHSRAGAALEAQRLGLL